MIAEWLFVLESQSDIDDLAFLIAWHNSPHTPEELIAALPSSREFPFPPIEQSKIIVPRGINPTNYVRAILAHQATKRFSVLRWGPTLTYSGVLLHETQLIARFFAQEISNESILFFENYCPLKIFYPHTVPRWYLRADNYKYISFACEEAIIPRHCILLLRALQIQPSK